jgi:peroxiredoxin
MSDWQPQFKSGDFAPDVTLKTVEGEDIRLSDLWQRGNTLITFIRHFGCPACRAMLKELETHKAELEQRGFQIVAIGMGTPKRTQEFVAEMEVSFPILADPRRTAYDAYRLMKMNWREQLRPAAFLKTTQQMLKYGGGSTAGQDVMQLGGTFIINSKGIITFAHTNKAVSDDPNLEMLLQAAA